MRTLLFRKFILMIGLVLYIISGFAQDTIRVKKFQYFGLHQVGWLAGSSMEKAGILTTNGVSFGNWYTGISTGIDWYGVRTIPLLADVHKAFGKGKNQPFVYGNAGVGFVWQSSSNTMNIFPVAVSEYRSGFTGEIGTGYLILLTNKTAFSISAGYSYKEVGLKEFYYSAVDPAPFNSATFYKYRYRRIALRIGLKI